MCFINECLPHNSTKFAKIRGTCAVFTFYVKLFIMNKKKLRAKLCFLNLLSFFLIFSVFLILRFNMGNSDMSSTVPSQLNLSVVSVFVALPLLTCTSVLRVLEKVTVTIRRKLD